MMQMKNFKITTSWITEKNELEFFANAETHLQIMAEPVTFSELKNIVEVLGSGWRIPTLQEFMIIPDRVKVWDNWMYDYESGVGKRLNFPAAPRVRTYWTADMRNKLHVLFDLETLGAQEEPPGSHRVFLLK
jgi:hypothetical protein